MLLKNNNKKNKYPIIKNHDPNIKQPRHVGQS
jgi:hypothetical protein